MDTNVAHEVFGDAPTPAGTGFLDWLSRPGGQLVVGGRLRAELGQDNRFVRWLQTNLRYGRARSVEDRAVEDREKELGRTAVCISNDVHVLALALVSGARLLYTNDAALVADFKNPEVIAKPRGKVYTTARTARFTTTHKRLLAARDLCPAPRS